MDEAEAKSSKRAERKARSTRRRLEASGAETVVGVGKGDSASARLTKIDLGQGKSVDLHVPSDVADVSGAVSPETLAQSKEALYGAGDVVWPAACAALARLIAHCPSLVAGKRVLEVGAGLGVVGNAALRAGASAVCMCDVDGDMLRRKGERPGKRAGGPEPSRDARVGLVGDTGNLLRFCWGKIRRGGRGGRAVRRERGTVRERRGRSRDQAGRGWRFCATRRTGRTAKRSPMVRSRSGGKPSRRIPGREAT